VHHYVRTIVHVFIPGSGTRTCTVKRKKDWVFLCDCSEHTCSARHGRAHRGPMAWYVRARMLGWAQRRARVPRTIPRSRNTMTDDAADAAVVAVVAAAAPTSTLPLQTPQQGARMRLPLLAAVMKRRTSRGT